jgi:uncharacterized membrane protein
VLPASIFYDLSPHARVVTAVLPFALAIFVRLVLGNNQLTRWMISLSVLWFAANILMAPYSAGMRQDIRDLRTLLP